MFKKTEKRSKQLLEWAKEDYKELRQLYKDLVNFIDNEDMLFILNQRIKVIRDSLSFYQENIVLWHLEYEDFESYKRIFNSKEDNTTNYMM